jgi:hypothetical protein
MVRPDSLIVCVAGAPSGWQYDAEQGGIMFRARPSAIDVTGAANPIGTGRH